MQIRNFHFVLAGALAVSLGKTNFADAPPVKLEQGWVRAVPSSSGDTVAYMNLTNTSDQALRLTGGRTAIAEMAMLMVTTKKSINGHEVIGMKGVEELTIPAHGQLKLAPDGAHLMLMRLRKHPKPGEKVQLTLHFEPGGKEITADLPVALNKQ